jgi:hypothetical protein
MGIFRVGVVIVATLCGVACSSASSAPEDPAWKDTESALGVTNWVADENGVLTGYDDAHVVRAQFAVEQDQDAEGSTVVRIKSLVQGPAVMRFGALPDGRLSLLEDTFRDHPDAQKALSLAGANIKAMQAAASDPTLVHTSSLHVLENGSSSGQLVGNQQQLICKDSRGRACEAPPSAGGTVLDCALTAAGIAGSGCLLTGAETLGAGCVIAAIGTGIGGLICAHDVAQRATCSCETPCAAQCHQTYNRQYMCSQQNPTPCTSAAQNDRRQEAQCVSGCGG